MLTVVPSSQFEDIQMFKNTASCFFAICLLQILVSSKGVCQTDTLGVEKGVRHMADAIVRDLHNDGPIAWLRYFAESNHFFMASNGQLAFPNNDSASFFVRAYAKTMRQIDLTWDGIRVDSLTPHLAVLAASFHEVLIGTTGKQDTSAGYFTGIVEYFPAGWKLRDAHWSIDSSKH
jgi:hypothetical protein